MGPTRMRPWRGVAWVAVLAFLNASAGCAWYTLREASPHQLIAVDRSKTLVLHQGGKAARMASFELSQTELRGEIGSAPVAAHPHEATVRQAVADEVHVYLDPAVSLDLSAGRQVSIPVSAVQDVKVYEMDKGATACSWGCASGAVGVAAGLLLVVVALAAKSFYCPLVYAVEGDRRVLSGELLAGAVDPRLERDDYLVMGGRCLPRMPCTIAIADEARQIQHIDLVELLAIDHPTGTRVVLGTDGRIHTCRFPVGPSMAWSTDGRLADWLLRSGGGSGLRREIIAGPRDGIERVRLAFDRPARASEAKLILRVRNTTWLDYAAGQYLKRAAGQTGSWRSAVDALYSNQAVPGGRGEDLAIRASLEVAGGWQKIGCVPPVGPKAYREIALPLTLPSDGPSRLTVGLDFGAGLWTIDRVTLDFSPDAPVRTVALSPSRVSGVDGREAERSLRVSDGVYCDLSPTSGEVVATFNGAQESPGGLSRTTVLHAKGFYDPLEEPGYAYEVALTAGMDAAGSSIATFADALAARASGGGVH